MLERELDETYTELCRALTRAGEERAQLLLARFALLAMHEIGDAGAVMRLVREAEEGLVHGGVT